MAERITLNTLVQGKIYAPVNVRVNCRLISLARPFYSRWKKRQERDCYSHHLTWCAQPDTWVQTGLNGLPALDLGRNFAQGCSGQGLLGLGVFLALLRSWRCVLHNTVLLWSLEGRCWWPWLLLVPAAKAGFRPLGRCFLWAAFASWKSPVCVRWYAWEH